MMEKTCSLLVSVTFMLLVHNYYYSLMACLAVSTRRTATNIITDQSALLALKSHITYDPHNMLAKNWTNSTSPCNWIGVRCSTRHHRVTALNLFDMGLRGTIPPHIGNLSFLTLLYIRKNSFHGDIPKEIGHLRRLEAISFYSNDFAGNLPKEISKLANLKLLDMQSNWFSGSIPASIFNISSLERIWFTNNNLSGNLPMDICYHLPKLYELLLSNNQFDGQIPFTLYECSELQSLSLSYNKFSGMIPSQIGNSTILKELYLGGNNFKGKIPQQLGNLHRLETLTIESAGLTGTIPSFVFNISSLKWLSLHSNNFTGRLPRGMHWHLPMLEIVHLGGNELYGSIPKEIGNSTSLMNLNLQKNSLTGSFGSVYRGTTTDGTILAIKVFNLQLEAASKSFDTECEMLRNIRHRNLTKVISSCSNLDFRALVLQYMPNGSLEKWLYSHNYFLNIIQRLDIMIDVACALGYLHHGYSIPLVHCDLKPNNVLLDEDMVAHVSDFGISKFLDEGESIAHTKTLATLGYIAPEYGLEGLVSTRSDVYSYGIMLMETFTRIKPTDDMFVRDLSLKLWVSESLPNAIIQVIDPNLLIPEEGQINAKVLCVSSIMEVALNCCAEQPQERINMEEALVTLKRIKHKFLATGKGEKHKDCIALKGESVGSSSRP
ncbi:receptor kinase-like protein Xa21 isoform X2 [Cornus florida]|uniref:receptor kinase-like protein Xa21 isoform X2 n=1 Tax=Cornus florida TaxID=4283 RepID=UPI00289C6A33|nr:receptor kinase-like protein Xa21 isoform X2 [Cornus florida]